MNKGKTAINIDEQRNSACDTEQMTDSDTSQIRPLMSALFVDK